MKPLIYKGLRLGTNKTEWVSSDEIKQSYSQIRLLAIQNVTYNGYQLRMERYAEVVRQKIVLESAYTKMTL